MKISCGGIYPIKKKKTKKKASPVRKLIGIWEKKNVLNSTIFSYLYTLC